MGNHNSKNENKQILYQFRNLHYKGSSFITGINAAIRAHAQWISLLNDIEEIKTPLYDRYSTPSNEFRYSSISRRILNNGKCMAMY